METGKWGDGEWGDMKNLVLTFLFICSFNLVKAQDETIGFINAIMGDKAPLYYMDNAGAFTYERITQSVSAKILPSFFRNQNPDTIVLSNEEISYIKGELNKAAKYKWPDGLLKGSKVIPQDTIESDFKDRTRGWSYYYKRGINKIYAFSKPIFFRNNTLCLFYTEYGCGYLCAEGNAAIYRKKNGKWEKWLVIYAMIS